MNDAKLIAIREEAERALARTSLVDFAKRMIPGFEDPAHIRHFCDLLERVERGELRRLMINVPPRHAKSTTVSMAFPPWYLGRNRRRNVILSSYGAELAERNSRAARAIVADDRYPFDARLAGDSTAVNRWNLSEGGGLYAVGVGGGITGRGADVLILDDVAHSAGTEGERAAAFEWYSSVAVPRLEPSASIICVGTRFHEDDLFGRILATPGAGAWHVVRLPAFAEENDPLGRKVGAPLWPERVTARDLHDRREEMGDRPFQAQFQQNPLPASGDLVKADWLSHRYERVPEDLTVIMALDAAAKTGISNDYSAIVVIGYSKNEYFILDVIRRKVDFPDLRKLLVGAYEKHHPRTIYVEDASNAVGLIQELRKESALPIVAVQAKGSKISRMEAQTGLLESGRVKLPADNLGATWLTDFLRELLSLPNGKHDDMADALFLALAQARRASSSTWSFATASTTRSPLTRPSDEYYDPFRHVVLPSSPVSAADPPP